MIAELILLVPPILFMLFVARFLKAEVPSKMALTEVRPLRQSGDIDARSLDH